MSVIALLIFISITIALIFLVIFIVNLRNGQFDDTTTPAMRMIFEDHKNPDHSAKVGPLPAADKNQQRD